MRVANLNTYELKVLAILLIFHYQLQTEKRNIVNKNLELLLQIKKLASVPFSNPQKQRLEIVELINKNLKQEKEGR